MAQFNRQDDKGIRPWAKWSWDPITGCEHNCRYCSGIEKARKLYSRTREESLSTFTPHLWPARLDAPYKTPIPESSTSGNRNVLVGSMGDIFGDWIEMEHIDAILDIIQDSSQWNYILLTKNPKRYLQFHFPHNCWLGVKIDTQREVKPALSYFERLEASVKFVSCDPMVEWLNFPTLACFDWMIIGPRPKTKGSPAFNPPKMWITTIIKQAKASGCEVFVKHLTDPRYRAYPGRGKLGTGMD